MLMRYGLVFLLLVHGLAHLVGFTVPWQLTSSSEAPYRTTVLQGRVDLGGWGIRLYGLCWLVLAAGCTAVAVGVWFRSSWWLLSFEALTGVSMVSCALGWPETRFGVAANFLILLVSFAAIRFSGTEIAMRSNEVERLWRSAPSAGGRRFNSTELDLPPPAQLMLEHAIAPGTVLASAVRLKMHGEIKLSRWHPFHAEQVISDAGDFVWAATISAYGLPIRGYDRMLQGEGSMAWKLLDLIPVVTADGPEITRSAIGRLHGELAHWLPSALLSRKTHWTEVDPTRVRVRTEDRGESTDLNIELDGEGRTRTVGFRRWGNPDDGRYRYLDFRVIVHEERRFGGFTIPSRITAAWLTGPERGKSEGEFFRATIDGAEYK